MMTWRVRVSWFSDGSTWETGGDMLFPDGTTWEEAVREVVRARGAEGQHIRRVEAEIGREDIL